MKKCCTCREDKPLEEFSPTSKRCKECWRIFMRGKLKRIRLELAGELPEKTCWRCHRTLSIESFTWNTQRSRGRFSQCRDCLEPDGPKLCSRCGEVKPRSEFYNKLGGRCTYCKPCSTEYGRIQNLRRQYGLTPAEYDALAKAQGGCCAICGKRADVLWVDHDHSCCPKNRSCGKCRRGLLCMMCNGGIGMLQDDVEILKKAITYLETHEAAVALAHGVLFRVA